MTDVRTRCRYGYGCGDNNMRSTRVVVEYEAAPLTPDMSFLEMLDVGNEDLQRTGQEPIAFDSDCREGICGTCRLAKAAVCE